MPSPCRAPCSSSSRWSCLVNRQFSCRPLVLDPGLLWEYSWESVPRAHLISMKPIKSQPQQIKFCFEIATYARSSDEVSTFLLGCMSSP